MQGGTQERLFETQKVAGEAFYNTLRSVSCPYFREQVFFTNAGLEHLQFKRRNKQRPMADQATRFRLLPLGVKIIERSHVLQGIWETRSFEKVRVHNRIDTVLKPITYFEFIGVLENFRIKVILKQIDAGQLQFWSVIPHWKRNKDSTRRLYSGNLNED